MKIEIKHIPERGLELVYHQQAAGFPVLKELMTKGECGAFAPLEVELNLRVEGDLIVAAGVFSTAMELACSRCVEPFTYAIRRRFTLRFSQTIPLELSGGADEEVELTAEQAGLIYFHGETLDLKAAIEEQVVMEIPFKPLCREACKGLCSRCGANLNAGQCACAPTEVASPFAVLRKLKVSSQ